MLKGSNSSIYSGEEASRGGIWVNNLLNNITALSDGPPSVLKCFNAEVSFAIRRLKFTAEDFISAL